MLLTPDRTLDGTYLAHAESVGLARSEVAAFAAREGATPEQTERIRLAVSEATTNVVRHAYPRRSPGVIHVTATALQDELWVLIADDGCGHQAPPVDPGLGWGLALIAEAASEFVITERADGGTEARMRFSLGR
jgi:serine/threonine-protein kinase RsbW